MISFSIFIHKWTGLFTAVFLIIAGVTGSLLAFEKELEALVNPEQSGCRRASMRGIPLPCWIRWLHAGAPALPGYQIVGFPFLREAIVRSTSTSRAAIRIWPMQISVFRSV